RSRANRLVGLQHHRTVPQTSESRKREEETRERPRRGRWGGRRLWRAVGSCRERSNVGGGGHDGRVTSDDQRPAGRAPLPARALDTTAENPWPVRLLSQKIADYMARMSPTWV